MSFAAIAIGVGAAATIGAGAMQADSARKTSNSNADAQREANQLNYQQFQEARGLNGNAILPMYAGANAEPELLRQMMAVTQALNSMPPEQRLAMYQQIVDSQKLNVASGDQVIADIFSGEMERQRQAEAQPVQALRTQAGDAQAQGINTALLATQNRIIAEEAAKGYAGGGSFSNNRLLASAIPARQDASIARIAAALANAQETQSISDQARDLQVRSLDVPVNRAAQLLQLQNAPAAAVAGNAATSLEPLNFFRLNPGNPPDNKAVVTSAVPSMGGVVASGVGQAAGAAGNYLAQQQLIKAIQASNQAAGASSAAANTRYTDADLWRDAYGQ